MSKNAIFTMKLDPELRDNFMAAAKAADCPASQLVRDFMRDYVANHQERQDYNAWLALKVERARESLRNGEGIDNAQVEREFAELRKATMKIAEK